MTFEEANKIYKKWNTGAVGLKRGDTRKAIEAFGLRLYDIGICYTCSRYSECEAYMENIRECNFYETRCTD